MGDRQNPPDGSGQGQSGATTPNPHASHSIFGGPLHLPVEATAQNHTPQQKRPAEDNPFRHNLASYLQLPGNVVKAPLTASNLAKLDAGQTQQPPMEPHDRAQHQQMPAQSTGHFSSSAQHEVYAQHQMPQNTISHSPAAFAPHARANPFLTPVDEQIPHFSLADPPYAPYKVNTPQNYNPDRAGPDDVAGPSSPTYTTARPPGFATVRSLLAETANRPEIAPELQTLIQQHSAEFRGPDPFSAPHMGRTMANTPAPSAHRPAHFEAGVAFTTDAPLQPMTAKQAPDHRPLGVHVRAANSPQPPTAQMAAPLLQQQHPPGFVRTSPLHERPNWQYPPQPMFPGESQEQWQRRVNPELYQLIDQQREMQQATQRMQELWAQARQGVPLPGGQGTMLPQVPLPGRYQPTVPPYAYPPVGQQQYQAALHGDPGQNQYQGDHPRLNQHASQAPYYQIAGTHRVTRTPPGLVHPALHAHRDLNGVDLQRLHTPAPRQAFGAYAGHDDRAYAEQQIARAQEHHRQLLQQQAAQQQAAQQQLAQQQLAQHELAQQQLAQHQHAAPRPLHRSHTHPSPFQHQLPPHLLPSPAPPPPGFHPPLPPVSREHELTGFRGLDWPYNIRRANEGLSFPSRSETDGLREDERQWLQEMRSAYPPLGVERGWGVEEAPRGAGDHGR